MTHDLLVFILLAYIGARELLYLYTTQKLVNKALSKNFYEYQQALEVGKKPKLQKAPLEFESSEESEDLGALTGIG